MDMFNLLGYLQRLEDDKTYPNSSHVATVSEYFKSIHTPVINIYNEFWENRGLDSNLDNEILKTYTYRVNAIYEKIEDETFTTDYDVTINDEFSELNDKFEDIYTIIVNNLQSKSNQYIFNIQSDKFNIVSGHILPKIKESIATVPEFTVNPNMYILQGDTIKYTYADESSQLNGVYRGVSPFLFIDTSKEYYESLYNFNITIATPKLSEGDVVNITTLSGKLHKFSTNECVIDAEYISKIYKKPYLVSISDDALVSTNSYIALYYNKEIDIDISPRQFSILQKNDVSYRSTSNVVNIYNIGIKSIEIVANTYYDTTTYVQNFVIPSDYKYYRLSDDTEVMDSNISVDGNDLLADRTITYEISNGIVNLELELLSTSSYVKNMALILMK